MLVISLSHLLYPCQ